MAGSYAGGAADTLSDAFRRFARYLNGLDERQAALFIAGCFVTFFIVLRLLTGMFESPTMLSMMIKFLVYFCLPLATMLGVLAGSYLEKRFGIRDDIFDFMHKYLPEIIPSSADLNAAEKQD
eukprot:CAMPEP_0181340932 /NCGR_PEP_ID=MMETSP1101-20121128/30121_1 /TAXON_ID=46948 /ORGANISM="Rhodomonas abbreviata, Strain Caron Lab Isolate" /LENGTH=121 /DNA_ID=CAMNT_0023452137 /DNA_START=88 /DNA_END=453 /DNA_ORIENTATION=+